MFACPLLKSSAEAAGVTFSFSLVTNATLLTRSVNDDCLECSDLPLCFGSCRLMPLLNHGVIDRVDCCRKFYDAVLKRLIIQDGRWKIGMLSTGPVLPIHYMPRPPARTSSTTVLKKCKIFVSQAFLPCYPEKPCPLPSPMPSRYQPTD